MGEAIITRRGGSGEVIVEFDNFIPSDIGSDEELTHLTPTPLSAARDRLAGASVGNYALFAGGEYGFYSNTVDAYYFGPVARLYMPIGTKYKFGESEEVATTNEIIVPVPLTGYIKYESGVVGTEGSALDDS